MKNMILTITVAGAMVAASMTAFGQQTKSDAEAKKDVQKTQKEIADAKKDSITYYPQFKKESNERIAENKKRITELKAQKASDDKEIKAKYDKDVLALEQRNNEMKKRVDGYNTNDKSTWDLFKSRFVLDMNELNTSLMSIGNKK